MSQISPSAAWYAAMSRMLIAAVTRIYPAKASARARDLELVRAMLKEAELAVTTTPDEDGAS